MQMTCQIIPVITSQFFKNEKVQSQFLFLIICISLGQKRSKNWYWKIESSTYFEKSGCVLLCFFPLPLFFAKFDLCKLDLKVFTILRLLCHCMPNRNSFLFFLHSKTEKRKTYISLFWVRRKIEQFLSWNTVKAILKNEGIRNKYALWVKQHELVIECFIEWLTSWKCVLLLLSCFLCFS